MDTLHRIETISAFNALSNQETLHPLVSVVDMSKAIPRKASSVSMGFSLDFYTVFLKEVKCGDLRYGKNTYDYQEGTLVFMAPGQVVTIETSEDVLEPKGYGLAFHPDLIHGTSLGRHMQEYTFFGYQSNEALHLSERERQIVLDCLAKINYELQHAIDKHSKKLIVTNIELFLDYCIRFYDRQFITRNHVYQGVLERFEALLTHYFSTDMAQLNGLPSVSYCAEQLNLSANYFGDLVKKETGRSAQEYIHSRLIDVAKERLYDRSKPITQVADELGYKYPQHFVRLFKQRVGQSPSEYRRTADASPEFNGLSLS